MGLPNPSTISKTWLYNWWLKIVYSNEIIARNIAGESMRTCCLDWNKLRSSVMHSIGSPNSKTSQEQSELWSSKTLAPESPDTCSWGILILSPHSSPYTDLFTLSQPSNQLFGLGLFSVSMWQSNIWKGSLQLLLFMCVCICVRFLIQISK